MKITFLGHAALHIQTDAHSLIVDPFISGNDLARGRINLEDLPADFILLTHAHQDHVLDVEAIAARTGAMIISNYEIVSYYQQKGFEGHPLNHGGRVTLISVGSNMSMQYTLLPSPTAPMGDNQEGFS